MIIIAKPLPPLTDEQKKIIELSEISLADLLKGK